MALLGTIVNTLTIIIGSLIGSQFNRIPEKIKETVTKAMALAVIILGIQMAVSSKNLLLVIGSLALGAVIGEWLDLEEKLNRLGHWLESKMVKLFPNEEGTFAQGFVTATLVFVIGAMAIVGAIDSGLRGDHQVLYTKAILDGFFSLIFATTLGIGVMFSAIPVFIYEGAITLCAAFIIHLVPQVLMDQLIAAMTATGGILIFAIGLNLLGLTKIKTANLLPGIVAAAVITVIVYQF